MSTFEIDRQLSFDDIRSILAENKQLILSAAAQQRISHCRQYLDKKMDDEKVVVYGINTGFGALCDTRIPHAELEQLQYNLLRSHACGMGDTVPLGIVKLMLLLKVQSLAYGHSGVQIETVQGLIDLFNLNILPVVYEQGSLGASGDLAPLAHLCLPLIGEGKVWKKEMRNAEWGMRNDNLSAFGRNAECETEDAAEALKRNNLKPVKLQSKEGLALINGTQFMSAYGVWCLMEAQKIAAAADTVSCISIDGFDARLDPFQPQLHRIRAHTGQVHTAENILSLLAGSEISTRKKIAVQDPYAFRCIPQVHGASKDTINYVQSVFETEINSVTDNPNVFPDEDLILSGGNFHGQPLALTLDFLAIAVAELGSISERRTYQLISGQRHLPAFLAKNPGLNSGLMIPQYAAASIASQNKQLCTPASVDSIVSSNGQEDHVSMGANAATKCLRVIENTWRILGIELLNGAQAMDFRRPAKSSETIEQLLKNYREKIPFMDKDRELHPDMEQSVIFLKSL